MTLLSLENVGKSYDQTQVLHDIHLHLAPSEFLVLIGGSGSGKTTLLRSAAGLERVTSGRVRLRQNAVDDPEVSVFVPPARRGLGMVFQDYALWPHLSCLENVMAALPARAPDRHSRAHAMLERMQIGSTRASPPRAPLGRPATARRHRPRLGRAAGPAAAR